MSTLKMPAIEATKDPVEPPKVRFKVVSSNEQDLTVALLDSFLKIPGSDVERELKDARTKWLAGRIYSEELCLGFDWAIAVMPDGTEVRVDGMHSSLMLREKLDAGIPLPDVTVRIRRYSVKDEAGLVLLFRQFNPRESSRTKSDVAGAYQQAYSDFGALDPATGVKILKGISWWTKNIAKLPVPKGDDIGELYSDVENHPFIEWIIPFMTNKNPEIVKGGAAVVGALMALHKVNPITADDFIQRMTKELEEDPKSPVKYCGDALSEFADPKKKSSLDQHERYYLIVTCFNMERQGLSIDKVLRINTKKDPPEPRAT